MTITVPETINAIEIFKQCLNVDPLTVTAPKTEVFMRSLNHNELKQKLAIVKLNLLGSLKENDFCKSLTEIGLNLHVDDPLKYVDN
jgi:hypothetical protein